MHVLDHPEFGQSATRSDGMFDLAVNAGGYLTVVYSYPGYVPAQRTVLAPFQDYVFAADVALVAYDTSTTTVELPVATARIARGSTVLDEAGERQATLIFPPGATAMLLPPDGGPATPLSTLTVRLTEFTTGPNGLAAMAAELPPTSKYTYALELSADEAESSGAGISFSQPVPLYVENFLAFPVGQNAPLGFYDRSRGQWEPMANGRVIKVLASGGGAADLDVDGDDVADTGSELTDLGISEGERATLAGLYLPGQTLWRVQTDHFTLLDVNWARAATDLPELAKQGIRTVNQLLDPENCWLCPGSMIEMENRVLGESIPLVGVPSSLNYTSARVGPPRPLELALTGPVVPSTLLRVNVEITVAGQLTRQSYAPSANLTSSFTWDGKDGYGRTLAGGHAAHIRIIDVFEESYAMPVLFGAPGVLASGAAAGSPLRRQGYIAKSFDTIVNAPWSTGGTSLGAWSLSQHHVYDPGSHTLYLGTGERVDNADDLGDVLDISAGGGAISGATFVGTVPAKSLDLGGGALRITSANDGGYWFTYQARLIKVDTNGNARMVRALPDFVYDLSHGPRGELYLFFGQSIWKYDPRDDTLSHFAGNGSCGPNALSAPTLAVSAETCGFGQTAVAADGTVYVSDTNHNQINRVTPDGIMRPWAFLGPHCTFGESQFNLGFCALEVPAASTWVQALDAIAIGPGGDLYVLSGSNLGSRIARIGVDGVIRPAVGIYNGDLAEGSSALNFSFGSVNNHIAVGPTGQVVFGSGNSAAIEAGGGYRIRQAQGAVTNVAGNGAQSSGGAGDHDLALRVPLCLDYGSYAWGLDGSVFFSECTSIRAIRSRAGGFGTLGDKFISSPDGNLVYHFDSVGRHLETLHALTGAALWTFGYDSGGRLISMTDGSGNVTSIARDGAGVATSITGPFGQVTALTMDGNGYLSSVTNPNSETTSLTYTPIGLLTSMTTAAGYTYSYGYAGPRDLASDSDPAGGTQTFSTTGLPATSTRVSGHESTRTTVLGRVMKATVEFLANGQRLQTHRDEANLVTTTTYDSGETKLTSPTGSNVTTTEAPDPRFGMQSPNRSATVANSAGGLTFNASVDQVAALSDPTDLFSLTSLVNTLTLNGQDWRSTYLAATKTFTNTTPEGRGGSMTIDALGRVVSEQVPGLAGAASSYDAQGRLTGVTSGPAGPAQRAASFGYNAQGYLSTLTDPMGHVVSFEYDLAGRLTKQILPDLREVTFTYDANGNMTSVTPPGRPAQTFAYNAVDDAVAATPPVVPGVPSPQTTATYDADRAVASVTRPGGLTTTLAYDSAGRLSAITYSAGQITVGYSATTGQITSLSAPGGEDLSFSYLGDVLLEKSWTGTVVGSVGYGYDNDFRVASQTVNAANSITFGYDLDGLMVSAGAMTLSYDPGNGALTGTTLGTVTDQTSYNVFGEPAAYSASSGGTLYSTDYTRDNLGRITVKQETIAGVAGVITSSYTYDAAGRLTAVTQTGGAGAGARTYTYDSNDNRVAGPGAVGAAYDAQDRMLTYGPSAYAYTPNGELLTKTTGAAVTTYTYDDFDNLRAVALPDGTQITYVIDGSGARVGKKVDGVLQQGWLRQGGPGIVAELDGSNAVVSRFVYTSGSNIPAYVIQGGVTYRIISDDIGSLRLVVNAATGEVVQRMQHDEWGQVTEDFVQPGFSRVPFGFGGGLYDPDTGLVRFGARDYDPETGRWTSKDPTEAGLNAYVYAESDPVNQVDPDGRQPEPSGWDITTQNILNRRTPTDTAEIAQIGKHFEQRGALAQAFAGPMSARTQYWRQIMRSSQAAVKAGKEADPFMKMVYAGQWGQAAQPCPTVTVAKGIGTEAAVITKTPALRLVFRKALPWVAGGLFIYDAHKEGLGRALYNASPLPLVDAVKYAVQNPPGALNMPQTPPPNRW